MDDGSLILAVFRYPHAPDDPVVWHTSGCRFVSNGSLSGSFVVSAKLARRLISRTH